MPSLPGCSACSGAPPRSPPIIYFNPTEAPSRTMSRLWSIGAGRYRRGVPESCCAVPCVLAARGS
jgi:hypothetical protein